MKSPGSRHGVARTGPTGEEIATLQVVVIEEILCAIYRAEQSEFSETLIYRISLEAKMVAFQNYVSITAPVQTGSLKNKQSSSTRSPQLPDICPVHL